MTSPSISRKQSSFRQWLMQVAIAFLLAWLLQFFVLELSWVRSSAMSPALHKGDFVLISKLHYGARTPATWLKVPLMEPFIGDSIPTFLPQWQSTMFRLPGLGSIERGDILCFNHPRKPSELPKDLRARFLGRCIGLPGDSVKINNLQVSHYEEDTLSRQFMYWVSLNESDPVGYLRRQGIADAEALNEFYLVSCTPELAARLSEQPAIRSIHKAITPRGADTETIFPYSGLFEWNKAFFGPLWVPRKGATIALNDSTIALYDWLLEYEQGNQIQFTNDGFRPDAPRKALLNGREISQYTFQQNYYFVLNDNRYHAEEDSRRFGLVPEQLVIGKAWAVLASFGNAEVNSNRFFEMAK